MSGRLAMWGLSDEKLACAAMAADAVLAEVDQLERPTAVEGICRFGFESSYTIDEIFEDADAHRQITKALLRLAPREERVIRLRHGFGVPEHTLREIAEQLDRSPEIIRQIEARALRKLRHPKRFPAYRPRAAHARTPLWPSRPTVPARGYFWAELDGKPELVWVHAWRSDIRGDLRAALGECDYYGAFYWKGQEWIERKDKLQAEGIRD